MRSIRRMGMVAVMVAFALCTRAPAQQTWTNVSSPTTARLWGLCYGNGQFVAVGETGTILTSPDGQVWSTQKSGTSAWLTAVTYAAPFGYIAVGDAGTILTSPDGNAWSSIPAPAGTPRLNAVIYGAGHFIAVGEANTCLTSYHARQWTKPTLNLAPDLSSFTDWWRGLVHTAQGDVAVGQNGAEVVIPSTMSGSGHTVAAPNLEALATGAGVTIAAGESGTLLRWTDVTMPPARVASGVTATLTSAAFDGTDFVVAGDKGTILVSRDAQTWTAYAAPTSNPLLAIAASPTVVVAVGDQGTIVQSTLAPEAPFVLHPPQSVFEETGNAVAFSVNATGTAPLAYQWRFNGSPIDGATNSFLLLPPVAADQEGQYSVTVANAVGSVTTAPASLTVTSQPLPQGFVDTSFAPSIPDGLVEAILPLADGSVIIGGDFNFTRPDGTVQHGLARLTATGGFDPSFAPGTGVSAAGGSADVTVLALEPDGRILVGGTFTQIAGTAKSYFARLDATGRVDATFSPALTNAPTQATVLADGRIVVADDATTLSWLNADGSLAQASAAATVLSAPYYIQKFDFAADGSIVTAGRDTIGAVSATDVVRFHADGSFDSVLAMGLTQHAHVYAVRILSDRSVAVAYEGQSNLGSLVPVLTVSLSHVLPNGRNDLVAMAPSASGRGAAYILPDGRAILGSDSWLDRYLPDGTVDPTFQIDSAVTGLVGVIVPAADGGCYVGGDFSMVANTAQPRLAKLHATGLTVNPPRIVALVPSSTIVTEGTPLTITAVVVGSGPLTLEWVTPALSQPQQTVTTGGTFAFTANNASAGVYSLSVSGPGGTTTATSDAIVLVPKAAPRFLVAPSDETVSPGRGIFLSAVPTSSLDLAYQWYFNGAPIPNAVGASYMVSHATADDAGTYSLVMTNPLGSTRRDVTVTVAEAPVLVNLSARAVVDAGDNALIVGFAMNGSKHLIVRGVGPTLARFGMTNVLPDPRVTTYYAGPSQSVLASNNDWGTASGDKSTLQIGFPLDAGSKDAACEIYPLGGLPGAEAFTNVVTGAPGTRGVALAEIYEDPSDTSAKLINLSARAYVGTGDQVLIAGFILQGGGTTRLLIRGVGPTLSQFGITAPLAHPVLTVYDTQHNVVATNSDWEASANATAIAAAATATGAFPLTSGAHDAAVLLTLPSGTYSATITGGDGGTGIGMSELYEVP